MKTMRMLIVMTVFVMVISCNSMLYAADPGSDEADCTITVIVNSIIEWEGAAEADHFPAIALTTIDDHSDSPEGSSNYTLWTNCHVAISADTADNDARLTDGTDIIKTEYKLTDNGNGVDTTGATAAEETLCGADTWTDHSTFLTNPMDITHVNTDGGVEITLLVRAVQEADEVPDSGDYSAMQTLTAAWVNDD